MDASLAIAVVYFCRANSYHIFGRAWIVIPGRRSAEPAIHLYAPAAVNCGLAPSVRCNDNVKAGP
jgi:hypothetical protein